MDLDGASIRPADAEEGSFAALVFITTDCPIANAFQPELRRLSERAIDLGGKLTLVHVDWDLEASSVRKHAGEFAITAPVVVDRDHRLVEGTGATITPEAVVIDGRGRLVYRGRINNLFADYGDRRREATQHDLRDAMERAASQAGSGKPLAVVKTGALGCYIPDFPAEAPGPPRQEDEADSR